MILRIIFVFITGIIGFYIGRLYNDVVLYTLIGLGISSIVATGEYYIMKKGSKNLFLGMVGMLIGLGLYAGFYQIYNIIFGGQHQYLLAIAQAIFVYLGFAIGFTKGAEFRLGLNKPAPVEGVISNYKILDTSVIIDGRIADIAETGFIEGIMVIPKFVLKELQQVADSSDPLKRSRGRRGLDILNKMKASKRAVIKITDKDFLEIKEVDHKLLKLASYLDGVIITNDYNLNKIAELEGIQMLNINDLANAVKPIVLPNEELHIAIIKEGKDANQGIGYLDDGTMVVVDNGKYYIGENVDVVVTSILQTPAGRMIFTQLMDNKKHSDQDGNKGFSRFKKAYKERSTS